jgi:hypothetical protein
VLHDWNKNLLLGLQQWTDISASTLQQYELEE